MHNEEIISAALDGERVELETLRTALAEPGGREALASFVLLRAAVAADDTRPGRAFYESMAPALRAVPRPLLRGFRIPAAIAASIIVLTAAASFWLGSRTRLNDRAPVPVTVAGRSPDTARQPERPPVVVRAEPPTPVRIVRFEREDWREGS